jgi:LacI family transcriptional regulator, fructose operon transcriptional repressor
MRATINDIAKSAGTSKTTVSLYLNKHPLSMHIAAATKARIDEAVERLHYRPSSTARALRTGRTKTLGLVIGDIGNPYFSNFAALTLDAASRRGYQLLVALTRWNLEEELRALEKLVERQVDGVVYDPAIQKDAPFIKELRKRQYPLILTGCDSEDFSTARFDTYPAHVSAVEYLHGKGHRRIAGLFGTSSSRFCRAGEFLRACSDAGVEGYLLHYALGTQDERLAALAHICRLRPDAIVSNAHITVGYLLNAIRRECPAYRPDIIVHLSNPCAYLHDERIAGVLFCDNSLLAEALIGTLVEMVEQGDAGDLRHKLLHAKFFTREDFPRLPLQADDQHGDNDGQI